MDTTVTDPLIGALLGGRYRIRGRVARGGMATVYHAVDERLERTVAVKIIHPTHAGKRQFTDRFEREAKMIARLAHPNIVAVYDEGDHDGLPYLVMEYVRGRTLRDVLTAQGRLSPAEALNVMASVLAALAAAHRAGLVHRDIKPENVLIADDGQIKVADFGLARAVEASGDEAPGGQLLATVAYVAPELVSSGHADPRADVYSAGIMLFELLTGRVPYEGVEAIDVAWQHVECDVPAPSSYAGTPAPLDELVARATRRDPGARPTDAGTLLAELVATREDLTVNPLPRTEAHRPVPEPAPTPQTQLISVTPRRRRGFKFRWSVIVPVATVVFLALLSGWWFGAGRYVPTPSLLTLSQGEAQTQAARSGFTVRVTLSFSETAAVGTVTAQAPEPGESILPGGVIGITVSKGPERHAIPAEVIGMEAGQALAMLRDATFTPTQTQQHSSTVESGKVIGVDPPVGTLLPPGTPVSITVSKGPPPVIVADVVGDKADDARRELEKLKLTVKITVREDASAPKDQVLEQSPAAGTGVEPRTTVTLVVSSGPPLVTVPDVGGMSFDEARKTLEAVGLVASKTFNWPGGRNTVYTQSPAANQQVAKGATVSLWLY